MSDKDYYLDQVKQCVSFIFKEKSSGEKEPIGTGFFVGIKLEYGDAVYLVTAKHVLQKCPGEFYDKIFVRLNAKETGFAEYMDIDLTKYVILTHSDESVDLAATFLRPNPNFFDYRLITQDYFSNSIILKKKNIREGSNVFFPGLFTNFYGELKNFPILRFGRISLLIDERIEIHEKGQPPKLAHLYFVECQSLGGFSGSPVFFERDRITPGGPFSSPEIYLGGVMKGHYNDTLETPRGIVRELNASLALVTPCYQLNELLNSEAAIKDRESAAKDAGL